MGNLPEIKSILYLILSLKITIEIDALNIPCNSPDTLQCNCFHDLHVIKMLVQCTIFII